MVGGPPAQTSPGFLTMPPQGGYVVALDTTLTPELVREGLARDFVRFVQEGRKQADLRIEDRIKTTYALRTFLEHGVRLALGTDWTVAPLDPMQTIYAAVTRATLDGKNPRGWVAEQKLTVVEAVEAYTMGSAYAEFQEKQKGSLTPGKLADMVLLSDDIFSVPPAAIRDVRVEATWVGGKLVFDRAQH